MQYLWSWRDFYNHWTTYWMTLTSPALLCIYLTSLAQLCICHLILPLFILFRELDTHYFHYVTLIFLTLFLNHIHWVTHYFALDRLIKLVKSGLLGETSSRRNQGGVLGRAAPSRALPHVFLCSWDLCARLLLHVTWYLSTVNYFFLLLGSTNASLVWYVIVLWDGTQDGCIS